MITNMHADAAPDMEKTVWGLRGCNLSPMSCVRGCVRLCAISLASFVPSFVSQVLCKGLCPLPWVFLASARGGADEVPRA